MVYALVNMWYNTTMNEQVEREGFDYEVAIKEVNQWAKNRGATR